jgi:hypothetical protein
MSLWYRTLFLFSSFGPLYLLLCGQLAVQYDWGKGDWKGGIVIAIGATGGAFALSFLVFMRLRAGFQSNSPSRQVVEPLESLDNNVLNYLIAYFPPFMIDNFMSLTKVVPVIIFYIVMIVIMIRSETLHVNPYFLLFGYRLHKARLPSKRSVILVTKKSEIMPEELLNLYEIQPSRVFYAD